MEAFIGTVASICDYVGGKKHSKKKLHLSFDEWNVWYHSHARDEALKHDRRWETRLPLPEGRLAAVLRRQSWHLFLLTGLRA